MSGPPPYPPPPWQTHGQGGGCAYVVPARSIDLPPGLRAVTILGRAAGMLAYIEYQPPSPLTYSELIWMPTVVKCRGAEGTSYGYYVAKMYVDDEASLAAGRELWALPKSLARFERRGDEVSIEADDGTSMRLSLRGFGPKKRLAMDVATIQRDPQRDPLGVIKFKCSFVGEVQLGSVKVESFRSNDPGWRSFGRARRVPGSSGLLNNFEATMHPPLPTRL